jgi:hypothetical protein
MRPETKPDVVGDWNRLDELFGPDSFDVVIWDPPHITDAGLGLVGTRAWADRYGTRSPGLRAVSNCHLFAPFLESARMVLDPKHGTLIVKLADQVHAGQLQWQPFELRRVAGELGWLACDYQVRVRPQPIDPKWQCSVTNAAARRSGWPCTLAGAVRIQAWTCCAFAPAPQMATCSDHAGGTS